MDELFEIPEQLSPRLAWIKKYDVRTHFAPHCPESPWIAWMPDNDDLHPDELPDGSCHPKGIPENPDRCGYGLTQDDAIAALARIYRIRLWNEEVI